MKKLGKIKPIDTNIQEDWHKPEYAEDPDNAPKTFKKPPKKYEENFLAKMDNRTVVYKILSAAHEEILADLGGKENLSHVHHTLVERFVFLELIMQNFEYRISQNPKKSRALLGRWIQALNSLTGLARNIGLKRTARKIDSLESYVKGKKSHGK